MKWLIGNPYAMLAIVLGLVASHAAVFIWRGNEVRQMVDAKWEKAYNQSVQLYSAKTIEVEGKYRDVENKRVEDSHNNDIRTKQELAANETKYKAIIAGLSAGTIKLRDPFPAGNQARGVELPKVGTDPTGTDGGGAGELSTETGGFLSSQAERGDKLAIKYNRCVRQLKSDREDWARKQGMAD